MDRRLPNTNLKHRIAAVEQVVLEHKHAANARDALDALALVHAQERRAAAPGSLWMSKKQSAHGERLNAAWRTSEMYSIRVM